jgi:formylglycine-generating enzyme required for sulfatase activity
LADIFISYAREDLEHARKLAQALEARGWSVWWDRRLKGGQEIHAVINAALAEARCVVVLWSRHSVPSRWVIGEANTGWDRSILVPARIDEVPLPVPFNQIHTPSLRHWDGSEGHPGLQALIDGVLEIFGQPDGVQPARPVTPSVVVLQEDRKLTPAKTAGRRPEPAGEEDDERRPSPPDAKAEGGRTSAPPLWHRALLGGLVVGGLAVGLVAVMFWMPKILPSDDSAEVRANMVEVPAGEFYYGTHENGDWKRLDAFHIDRTEVTVAAYRECVDDEGKCTSPNKGKGTECNWDLQGREDHPVNCVAWSQANQYCKWRGARLPTELEWEKAARGTDGWEYPWGNDGYSGKTLVANIGDETAGLKQSTWPVERDYNDGYYATAPVGSFPKGASPYGALDMMGNVWEWTSDWWDSEGKERVVRGGSWHNNADGARASHRTGVHQTRRSNMGGFRCAK